MATTPLYFYVPGHWSTIKHRADQRVKVLDYDEVSMTSRVEFPDGLQVIVDRAEIVSREVTD